VRDGGSEAVADVLGQMLRRNAISMPELMETRQLLEVHNAALAARRASSASIAAMEAAIERMTTASGPWAFVEADVAFHVALAGAAGNRVLAALLGSLRPLLLQGMLIGTAVDGAREAAISEHAAILAAIERQDGQMARSIMEGHLRRGFEEWVEAGFIKAGEPSPPTPSPSAVGEGSRSGSRRSIRQPLSTSTHPSPVEPGEGLGVRANAD
jgi:DNA-binding FadR family transcriptional regulator